MFGPLIELIDCQTLYNVLNEGIEYSKLADRYYLYLLDCRPRSDYNESHIISAKNVKRNDDERKSFRLPYEAELESCNMVVIYDSNTSTLEENGFAMECAKLFSDNGSKFSVKILRGGYELFSKYYPFLRSQQIIFMPKELDELRTYPSEIIPGLLYLGNNWHGTEAYIKKDLKLKAYLDCSNIPNKTEEEKSLKYLKVPIEDEPESNIETYLDAIVSFIDLNVKDLKQPCLVYSKWGLSRSAAAIIAYLVVSDHLSVEEAFERVSKCRKIQPRISFLEQIQSKYLKSSDNHVKN